MLYVIYFEPTTTTQYLYLYIYVYYLKRVVATLTESLWQRAKLMWKCVISAWQYATNQCHIRVAACVI
jgi:hypothetical protein